jgi:hypothetical protein
MVGCRLFKVSVTHVRWGYLGHGLFHLRLVMEPIAQAHKALQEHEAFLALVDGRVLDGLTHELLRLLHYLHCRMG